jgi:putative ABC transport system substrate-binding protein
MKRRGFMAVVAGTAAWSIKGGAQTAATPKRVVLLSAAANPVDRLGRLREQLAASGYVEGRNIVFDIRSAEGHLERLPALAEALANEGRIDAILAESTPAAVAARRATQTIPIVAIVGPKRTQSIIVDPLPPSVAAHNSVASPLSCWPTSPAILG